jgi:hypothetical protein
MASNTEGTTVSEVAAIVNSPDRARVSREMCFSGTIPAEVAADLAPLLKPVLQPHREPVCCPPNGAHVLHRMKFRAGGRRPANTDPRVGVSEPAEGQ